jgi:hypothetical protein
MPENLGADCSKETFISANEAPRGTSNVTSAAIKTSSQDIMSSDLSLELVNCAHSVLAISTLTNAIDQLQYHLGLPSCWIGITTAVLSENASVLTSWLGRFISFSTQVRQLAPGEFSAGTVRAGAGCIDSLDTISL